MTLGKYLLKVLTQDAGVAARVKARVYSEVLPDEGEMPAVVFDLVSEDEDEALDGPTGVRRASVTVDCWAEKRVDATALGKVVKDLLSGHAGAAAGLEVQSFFFVTQAWDFDAETKLFRSSQDYEVWYSGDEAE